MDWEALCVASPAGFEPATESGCSTLLSYGDKIGAGTETQTRLSGVEARHIDLLCYTRKLLE